MVKKGWNSFWKLIEEKALIAIFTVCVTTFITVNFTLIKDHLKLQEMSTDITKINTAIGYINLNFVSVKTLQDQQIINKMRDDFLEKQLDKISDALKDVSYIRLDTIKANRTCNILALKN
jgi:ABC-type phosphate transport system substrate-binding protein